MSTLRQNVSGQRVFFVLINSSTGAGLTGATVNVNRGIDGGAQAAATGTVTELGLGQYRFDPSQADTNGDHVGYIFTAIGAIPVGANFVTTNANPHDGTSFGLSAVASNVVQISGDSAAADALETMLDGTGGNTFTLAQLRINSTAAGGAIDIDNSTGPGISCASNGSHGADFQSNGGNGNGVLMSGNGSGHGLVAAGGLSAGSGVVAIALSGNAAGFVATGSGTGDGMIATGGANGNGAAFEGGSSAGSGIVASATAALGTGIAAFSVSDGHGVEFIGAGTGNGLHVRANGAAAAYFRVLGAGNAILAEGGTASGHAIRAVGVAGNAAGLSIAGQGSAPGVSTTGGATGHGASFVGGATSGDGINTTGGGAGDGIEAVGTGGGFDINADIQGSLSGSVGSVTGSVGSVTGSVGSVVGNVGGNVVGSVGSIAAGGITAASIATDAIDGDALSATAVTEIVNGVWDELISLHSLSGSTGEALSNAGASPATIAAAVWDEARLSHTTVGTFGEGVASVQGPVVGSVGSVAANGITASSLDATAIAEIADGVWDEDIVAAHGTADTSGLILSQLTRRAVTFNTAVDDDSVIGQLADDGTATFDRTTDSLQAIADSGGGGPTAAQIADAVWDEAIAGHLTAGSTGEALNNAASGSSPGAIADAVWDELRAGHVAAGSFGEYVLADTVRISGDAAAADAFETMLDGTGGNKLTLEQLRINSTSAGGGIDVDNSAGPGISTTATGGNDNGLIITGNGAGAGTRSVGGATGHGFHAIGVSTGSGFVGEGGTSGGTGIVANATGGNAAGFSAAGSGTLAGIAGLGGSTSGAGFAATGGGPNGHGLIGMGSGTGSGIRGNGGNTGHGFHGFAGATSGDGFRVQANANGHGFQGIGGGAAGNSGIVGQSGVSGHGFYGFGDGAGAGMRLEAGATGHGLDAVGGATSGDGIHGVAPTAGDGMELVGAGGGFDLNADIQGSLSGSVGSVTGSVGSVVGNVGGNVNGSVGSVVGNVGGNVNGSVGSVVGNVGGNVVGNVNGSVGSVVGNVGGNVNGNVNGSVGSVAANGITASSLDATAIAEIADGVWDEDIVAAHGTADTSGLILSQLTRRTVTFNTAVADGSIIGQIADDGVSAFDRTTDSLQAIADAGGGGPTAGQIADAVWDELRAGHVIAGSFGEGVASVQGNVTGSVGSVTGSVGSVVGNVGGNVVGSVGSVVGSVGSVVGNVGGNVTGSVGSIAAGGITAASFAANSITAAATDTTFTTEIEDTVWDATIASHLNPGSTGEALDNASTGGGGTDWTGGERDQIRQALGITGTTAATTGTGTLETGIAGVQSDTNDIQTRLPASLSGGRMRSQVEGLDAGTITASATDATFALEIEDTVWDAAIANHLDPGSTGEALDNASTGGGGTDWTVGERAQIRQALGITGAIAATTGAGTLELLDASILSAVAGVQADTDDLQSRLPLTLNGGRMRSHVEACDPPCTGGGGGGVVTQPELEIIAL